MPEKRPLPKIFSSARKVGAQHSFGSCRILCRVCFNRLICSLTPSLITAVRWAGLRRPRPKCSTETGRHSRNHHIWAAGTPYMDTDVKPDFPTRHVVIGGYPLFSFWMTSVHPSIHPQQPKRETTAHRGKIETRIPNEFAFRTMFKPHLEQTELSLQTICDPEVLDLPATVLSVQRRYQSVKSSG